MRCSSIMKVCVTPSGASPKRLLDRQPLLITVSSKKRSLFVLVLYAFVGGLIHLALDALPSYPLRPLAPLSSHDYALGLFWWRDPFFKVTALIGIALILILPRLLARPLLLVGLVVMAGRVAVAFLLHR